MHKKYVNPIRLTHLKVLHIDYLIISKKIFFRKYFFLKITSTRPRMASPSRTCMTTFTSYCHFFCFISYISFISCRLTMSTGRNDFALATAPHCSEMDCIYYVCIYLSPKQSAFYRTLFILNFYF